MVKKFCDKCGKELNDKPWWLISADHLGQYKQGDFERDFYHFDLCDECMRDLIVLLDHRENN